jgi:proline dehydrogenase
MMLRAPILYLSRRRSLQRVITAMPLTARVAYRFVAGDRLDDALAAVRRINQAGSSASLDHLGENVTEERAARAAAEDYLRGFERIAAEGLDANVSIKLTQLGLDISPALCQELLERILRRAAELNNFVRVDMEGSAYTERTLDMALAMHARYPNCGVVLQSYLYRTLDDVERMNQAGIRVRLVKGAYDEPPTIAYPRKQDVDESFRKAMRSLLRQGNYPAIATHDELLISETIAFAAAEAIGSDRFEFQLLYGIRRDLQERLTRLGFRVRIYVPYGTEWYRYLTRRLAERPANLFFFVGSVLRERRAVRT